MNPTSRSTCAPRDFQVLAFHDAARHFRDGHDTPRAYLDGDDSDAERRVAP